MLSKRRLWLAFAASLIAFGAAGWFMALRIADFNQHADFARFNARLIADRTFQLPGFPPVSLTDANTIAGTSDVATADKPSQFGSFLRLQFGERELLIPVRSPPVPDAPNLGVYDEWVKVMAITQMQRSDQTGETHPSELDSARRLLIVTRTTPPGYDPASWGSVRRNEWVFTFYNLHPDGSIDIEQRRWPRKRMSEQSLQQLATIDASPPISTTSNPTTSPGSSPNSPSNTQIDANARSANQELAAILPLGQRTVEYFAAMHVIPKLNVPSYKFTDTAFSFAVLGWTAPVAVLGFLVMTLSLVFAAAPRRA